MKRGKSSIAALRHRLVLCSQDDVVSDNGNLVLNRKAVQTYWASVEARRASAFSRQGSSVKENRDSRTHVIYIRKNHELNISVAAWLYEERRKSPSRWFKILEVQESEQGGSAYFEFHCRLMERSDTVVAPTEASDGPAASLPEGVQL